MTLDYRWKRLSSAMEKTMLTKKQAFVQLTAGLDAMSPLKVLSRGYSMTKDADGNLLTDASRTKPGDEITVTLQRGTLQAQVTAVKGGTQ